MTERELKIVVGSLLHDIGKVTYRSGVNKNHSQSGYEFLKNEVLIKDKEILDCVRYHHSDALSKANIPDDSIAYFTYYADNVASALDRRENDESNGGFDRSMPLESVFNILNGNKEHKHFLRYTLDTNKDINYPTNEECKLDSTFYKNIVDSIEDNLRGIELTDEYINSLLTILEATITYIPSSTSKKEVADVSLYDHVKITAAVAQCIEQYLNYKNCKDYKTKLFKKAKESYSEKMFLLYSMDISGIQEFIYTIASKGALKSLRARSFYLEIIMEHIIDELLKSLSLTRANLIYCGGGHAYMLLPNTPFVKSVLEQKEKENNTWFRENFGITLYIAGGMCECSADNLKNEPEGSYSELYINISHQISAKKAHRYTANEIIKLNSISNKGERECVVCRKTANVNSEGKCPICASLEKMGTTILHEKYFTVFNQYVENSLILPGNYYLVASNAKELKEDMQVPIYVRSYTKNEMFTGKHVTTKLWVGDYTTGDSFEEFAKKATGINRIGILRADVDNLGQTFVHGFENNGDGKLSTLSRTATLSRQLSLFFKLYINNIMQEGEDSSFGHSGKRNAAIVYSGGDDVFIAGAWSDVIEIFIDLHDAFKKFTQNTLTISGGIGIYPSKYPVNIMAEEVLELEELSKSMKDKDSITLFGNDKDLFTFKWRDFLNEVIAEKFDLIYDFFIDNNGYDKYGKSFLYHLLDLIRNTDEKINFARYAYLLSRMEPDERSSESSKNAYKEFSKKMYKWINNEKDKKELIMAIYLNVYLIRTEEK